MKYILFIYLISFLFLSCQEKGLTLRPRELNVLDNEEVLSLKKKLSSTSRLKIHYGRDKIFDLAEDDLEVIKYLLDKELLFRLQLVVKSGKMYIEKLKIQTDTEEHEGDTILSERLYNLDGVVLNKLEELHTLYLYMVRLNTTIRNNKLRKLKVKASYFDTLNIENEENFHFLAFELCPLGVENAFLNLKKQSVDNLVLSHSTVLSKGRVNVKNFYYMNSFYAIEEEGHKKRLATQYEKILSTVQEDSLCVFEYDYKDMKKHNVQVNNKNIKFLGASDLKEYNRIFTW